MSLRTLRTILILTLIPEVLIIGFFVYARVQSPPTAGRGLALAQEIPYPAVVAHRGASYLAPEETRPAYLLARDLGADYLEGDVQRTKDGTLVLVHDDTVERTTNAAAVFPGREKQNISQFTYQELLKLDAGSWFNAANPARANPRFKDLRIITLDEMLTIAETGIHKPGIYLETKSPELFPGIEKELVALLKKRGWLEERKCDASALPESVPGRSLVKTACTRGRVILQSFSEESVRRLRELAPDVPRVLLVDEEMAAKQGWLGVVSNAASMNAGLGPVGYLGYPWHTGPAHRAGRLVHIYTINKTWQLWLLSQFGADGFFTDRSEMALQYFDRIDEPDTAKMLETLVF